LPTRPLAFSLVCFYLPTSPRSDPYSLSLHDALPIWFPSYTYFIQYTMTELLRPDCSIRKSTGIAPTYGSPWLIAVCHVLHRLLRSEEHTSELQSRFDLVCRLLLEKKNRLPSLV